MTGPTFLCGGVPVAGAEQWLPFIHGRSSLGLIVHSTPYCLTLARIIYFHYLSIPEGLPCRAFPWRLGN